MLLVGVTPTVKGPAGKKGKHSTVTAARALGEAAVFAVKANTFLGKRYRRVVFPVALAEM